MNCGGCGGQLGRRNQSGYCRRCFTGATQAGNIRSNSYHARHQRVHAARGKAAAQKCARCAEVGTDRPARDWATIHGETGDDPWADYVALCRSCHIAYDGHYVVSEATKAKIGRANSGRTVSELTRSRISESHRRAWAAGRYDGRRRPG